MPVPLLDLSAPHRAIREQAMAAVGRLVDSGAFILGPAVAAFESHLADWCGARHAIGCSSGTDALLLALMALDIGPGDEVIVPSFTFFATAGCVYRAGARPVFVDILPDTFNIDPAAAAAAVTPRTRAILPVHLFGQCADMQSVLELAGRDALHVIEDAAQALGARYRDQPAGTLGHIGALSFFPTKNLGALGDAGACLTMDPAIDQKMRCLRIHGQTDEYHHALVGGNFRLDAVQAAVLDIKLRHLAGAIEARRRAARHYDELLADVPVITPITAPGQYHSFNYYTIRVERRDDLCRHLQARGIGHKVYYPVPLHLQPCFALLGGKPGQLPHSELAARQVLSLPLYPGLVCEQQEQVAAAIADFYKG